MGGASPAMTETGPRSSACGMAIATLTGTFGQTRIAEAAVILRNIPRSQK